MSRSLKLLTMFNIPLRLHWTFVLVFVYIFYLGKREHWDLTTIAWATAFVLALFVCVALHEYGHALMARRFGVSTQDIILSPIGGVARLDRLPSKPAHELLIAIAGPLVNLVIALLISLYFFSFPAEVRVDLFQTLVRQEQNYFLPDIPVWGFWLIGLLFVNIMLAFFNLLPAFPMDGGRVLRALLSFRLGRLKATWLAAGLGQILAVLFAGFNLIQLWETQGKEGYVSLFIGVFIFLTARNEYRFVAFEEALRSSRSGDLVRRQFTPCYVTEPVSKAINLYGQAVEKNFLVFDEWQNLVGVLPEHRIIQAHQAEDTDAPISSYMLSELLPLQEEEPLTVALGKLQYSRGGALPVYNEWNTLVGILDTSGMDHYMKRLHRS